MLKKTIKIHLFNSLLILMILSLSSYASLPTPQIISLDQGRIKFELITLDLDIKGPASITLTDFNNNGKKDIIVSEFGNMSFPLPKGKVNLYIQQEDVYHWKKITLLDKSMGIKFPNDIKAVDIDNNGKIDFIIPYGFVLCELIPFGKPCGGITLLKQTENLKFKRYDIRKPHHNLFYHKVMIYDLDNDGIDDLIAVGERKKVGFFENKETAEIQFFKGKKEPPYFESEPVILAEGLGSFPQLIDVNNSGLMDFVGAEYFNYKGDSFVWIEQIKPISPKNPRGIWERHVIDNSSGPSMMFNIIPNLFGDHSLYGIGSNHSNTANKVPDPWESGLYLFYPTKNFHGQWNKVKLTEGIVSRPDRKNTKRLAPGVFGYGQLDSDDDIDFILSGDGDDRVFFIEQTKKGKFKTHVLLDNFGQAGGMVVDDLDGDGIQETVFSSYEKNRVYILKNVLR